MQLWMKYEINIKYLKVIPDYVISQKIVHCVMIFLYIFLIICLILSDIYVYALATQGENTFKVTHSLRTTFTREPA